MLVEIDPKEEHYKEVYAQFGLAVYYAQVFEQGLVNMITLFILAKTPGVTRELFEELFTVHAKKTLGRLINIAKKHVSFPEDNTKIFEEALGKRNYLIHHYFFERIDKFTTSEGREEMLSELEEIRKCLSEADDLIDPITDQICKKLGFTHEMLEKAAVDLFGPEVGANVF